MPFDATPAKKGVPIVVEPFQTATGVDADCLRGRLYWSDTTGREGCNSIEKLSA